MNSEQYFVDTVESLFGKDNVEDFKFGLFEKGITADQLLEYSAKMLLAEPKPLRDL